MKCLSRNKGLLAAGITTAALRFGSSAAAASRAARMRRQKAAAAQCALDVEQVTKFKSAYVIHWETPRCAVFTMLFIHEFTKTSISLKCSVRLAFQDQVNHVVISKLKHDDYGNRPSILNKQQFLMQRSVYFECTTLANPDRTPKGPFTPFSKLKHITVCSAMSSPCPLLLRFT